MITIEEYHKAKQELDKLNKEEKMLHEKQKTELDKIHNYYWEMERALCDRKDKEYEIIEDIHKEQDNEIQKRMEPHTKILSEYNKILIFMEIYKSEKNPNDFIVYRYEGYYPDQKKKSYIPIDTIKNDKYAKIQVFITPNSKPKNCYSLVIAGRTIFYESIIRPPYTYGCDCNHDGANILFNPIDKPTEDELKAYYKKRKQSILKEFLDEHKKIEKEYEEVIKNTSNKQWEIIYWEYQKDYYENHYHMGIETGEYKEILKQLKKLNA
jgi:hypothetical protein